MSTNSTAIRDAVFSRVRALTPTGSAAWGLASVATKATLNTTDLPALQVIMIDEKIVPMGVADIDIREWFAETQIGVSILRGENDPVILDGQADSDIDAILNALLTDITFISPVYQDKAGFNFRGINRINNSRKAISQNAESYLIELALVMTFESELYFTPIATVPLTGVAVSVGMFSNNLILTPQAGVIGLSGSQA